jgi:hypothetical protein
MMLKFLPSLRLVFITSDYTEHRAPRFPCLGFENLAEFLILIPWSPSDDPLFQAHEIVLCNTRTLVKFGHDSLEGAAMSSKPFYILARGTLWSWCEAGHMIREILKFICGGIVAALSTNENRIRQQPHRKLRPIRVVSLSHQNRDLSAVIG